MYKLRLWTTTVENTLPMHHQICTLQIFPNFLWFLNRIPLFSKNKTPQVTNYVPKQTGFITYIVRNVIYYHCAKCSTKCINKYYTKNYFKFLVIFTQSSTILPKIAIPIGPITCIIKLSDELSMNKISDQNGSTIMNTNNIFQFLTIFCSEFDYFPPR